jgi:thiol-disulfide isomerase/thioredoxin
MKSLWSLILGLVLLPAFIRAADPNPDANAAAADAAWADLAKNFQPPTPPAEWNTKRPTRDEENEFKRKAGDSAEALAERIKKFYETYPDHPKVTEARNKEKSFRQYAVALRDTKDSKPADNNAKPADASAKPADNPESEIDPAYKAKYFEAMGRIRDARQNGPPAVIAELEKSGRELARQWPKRPEPWDMLMTAAQFADSTRSLDIYKEIAANASDPEMRAAAAGEVTLLNRLNKPLALSYKSIEDKPVDLAKLKGKVVLVDFWAMWCAACIQELPNVLKIYEELHDQGFEIVGVSFDEDCEEMKRFVTRNKIPWPQFCDGAGWKNGVNKEFSIHALPSMFLVDKKGILRDMRARENLGDKVRALLKETE